MLTDIVSTIIQEKLQWTKTPVTYDLSKIFLTLSKTSPEVFVSALTTKGDLLPSSTLAVWVAANNILGSSWVLVIKIVTTTKSILKLSKKKLKGCALTFSHNCVIHNTSCGHFYLELLRGFLQKNERICLNSLNTNTKSSLI